MTEPTPFLHVTPPRGASRAIALVLHGGRVRGTAPTRARQLAVVRMTPFLTSLHRAGARHGLAVARMRYLVRGWNGTAQSPVADVRWALDHLAQRFPDVPVALVGHSMGGRAALYAADHHSVAAVVGLAPWIEAGDPAQQLAGRRLLIAHGDLDRMTSAAASAAFANRARKVAESAAFVGIHRERHAMLRRARLWHQLTTGYVLDVMCGIPPGGTVGATAANALKEVLAGTPSLVI